MELALLIYTENLIEAFEHYKKAFNAIKVCEGYGDNNELIHLEMDINGYKIALSPGKVSEITKSNVTVIWLKFREKVELMKAYDTLKEGGLTDGLNELPWSPLEGFVTDKYGVVWCLGLYK